MNANDLKHKGGNKCGRRGKFKRGPRKGRCKPKKKSRK